MRVQLERPRVAIHRDDVTATESPRLITPPPCNLPINFLSRHVTYTLKLRRYTCRKVRDVKFAIADCPGIATCAKMNNERLQRKHEFQIDFKRGTVLRGRY